MARVLPLFPLRIVLFPGAFLPLHIFEPRYQQLLADVSAGDHRFGLLPPGEAGELPEPGSVGCIALVRAVQPLSQGRANIVVSGERRFRFLGPQAAGTPYNQGQVEWLDDTPDVQVPSGEDIARLRSLGHRYAHALHSLRDQESEVELGEGPGALSFEVAALLEWAYDAQQQFLEIRSATERVTRLLHLLPGLLHGVEERAVAHARAKTNGYGVAR